MVAAASSYKFEDADRRAQYERLLADLNFIIKNNSINVIWDDVSLMEGITALLQEITALVKAQEIEDKEKYNVWTREQCIEWAMLAGVRDPQKTIDTTFTFESDGIVIEGGLRVGGSVTHLPEGIVRIKGTLSFFNSNVEYLPASLKRIDGTLDLSMSGVRELPENLVYIGDNFEITYSHLKSWPPKLSYIGGNLNYNEQQEHLLPSNIKDIAHGNLELEKVF